MNLNNKFQEDYKKYLEIINNISDPAVQKEAQNLLNSLSTRVRNIDKMHSELITGNTSALDAVGNERKKIIEIRKSLDNKLKRV